MPLHAPAILSNATVPVRSGSAFRVDSPSANALVTPELAAELHRVLERFAVEAGAGERQPVRIFFKPGIFGHHQVGRAADIYAVNGLGLDKWKQRWNTAMKRAAAAETPLTRRLIAETEEKENLGWRLQGAPAIWAVGAALWLSRAAFWSVDADRRAMEAHQRFPAARASRSHPPGQMTEEN
jgi:hypothetical protein